MIHYDDPHDVARIVAQCPRPLVIGLDVDGVLAPLVDHADDAHLLDGMSRAISDVARLHDVHVAVVSGRSVEDLGRFGFGDDVEVIGSHGMEARGRSIRPLTAVENRILEALDAAAVEAAAVGGEGAWVERKPASVALHVRQAADDAGRLALDRFGTDVDTIDGAFTKAGSEVLEAFARHADKGSAMVELGRGLGAAATVFVGDDITDEDAFAKLGHGDVTIKVGDADTIARHRLRDPATVLAWLHALTV